MEEKRLFDILKLYIAKYPNQEVALARKESGNWKKFSIQEYVETTNNISYALIELGIKKDDKVGIICSNRPEWNMLDMAIMQTGAVSVPIYPTISKEDYQYIINDCGVKLIVLEGQSILQKIESVKDNAPSLTAIYTIGTKSEYPTFEQLVEIGKNNPNPEELKRREVAYEFGAKSYVYLFVLPIILGPILVFILGFLTKSAIISSIIALPIALFSYIYFLFC